MKEWQRGSFQKHKKWGTFTVFTTQIIFPFIENIVNYIVNVNQREETRDQIELNGYFDSFLHLHWSCSRDVTIRSWWLFQRRQQDLLLWRLLTLSGWRKRFSQWLRVNYIVPSLILNIFHVQNRNAQTVRVFVRYTQDEHGRLWQHPHKRLHTPWPEQLHWSSLLLPGGEKRNMFKMFLKSLKFFVFAWVTLWKS